MEFRGKEKKYEAPKRSLEKFERLALVSLGEDLYLEKKTYRTKFYKVINRGGSMVPQPILKGM